MRNAGGKVKVLLVGVGYSPNLGDGVIAESTKYALESLGISVAICDLAGRRAYSKPVIGKKLTTRVLGVLPPFIRFPVSYLLLSVLVGFVLKPFFRKIIQGVDAVVLGGGNIFSDHDLNFPMKISAFLNCATEANLPVHVWSVGVGAGWSETGLRMIQKALAGANVVSVSVRDAASKGRWQQLFSSVCNSDVNVVRDPGLMAKQVYGEFEAGKSVAIGIMGAHEIAYHSSHMKLAGLNEWYCDLIGELLQRGERVRVFSNGHPEDRLALGLVKAKCGRRGFDMTRLSFVEDEVRTPSDLARTVATSGAVIAFRMHAIVLAQAYGVPFLALPWDVKVQGVLNVLQEPCGLMQESDFRDISKLIGALDRLESSRAPFLCVDGALAMTDALSLGELVKQGADPTAN